MNEQTIQLDDYLEITVRRPNTMVEHVRHPTLRRITPLVFAQIVVATRQAGKGECLSYRTVTKTVAAPQPTAADLAEEAYYTARRRIEQMGAGGERNEVRTRRDNTPAHPTDY